MSFKYFSLFSKKKNPLHPYALLTRLILEMSRTGHSRRGKGRELIAGGTNWTRGGEEG